jgi:hypothetical protein
MCVLISTRVSISLYKVIEFKKPHTKRYNMVSISTRESIFSFVVIKFKVPRTKRYNMVHFTLRWRLEMTENRNVEMVHAIMVTVM